MGLGTKSVSDQGSGAVFYRFQDASGRVHIVDSLDLVPMAQRGRVERVSYDEQTSVNGLLPAHGPNGWQMFALGVGAALLLALLFRRLPNTMRFVLRVAIVAGVVALLGSAYFGWARRTARQSNDVLATPGALIDDAKAAVDKMNARIKAQQAELKEAAEAK
jgi:hypothetical protein